MQGFLFGIAAHLAEALCSRDFNLRTMLLTSFIAATYELGRKSALDFLKEKVKRPTKIHKLVSGLAGGFGAAIGGFFGFESGAIFCELWLQGMEAMDSF